MALIGLAVVPTFLTTDLAAHLKEARVLGTLLGVPFYYLVLTVAVGAWALFSVALFVSFPQAPAIYRRLTGGAAVSLTVMSPLFLVLAAHQIVRVIEFQF